MFFDDFLAPRKLPARRGGTRQTSRLNSSGNRLEGQSGNYPLPAIQPPTELASFHRQVRQL